MGTQRQCFSISLSIGHSHTQPTQTSTDFATRKKMPLSLHTRISSALMKGLLASFILVVAADAAHNPALTHEENIKAALGDWERGLSGKPINCRRFVDLFIDDGVWSSPAGARNKLAPDMSSKTRVIKGQRAMYSHCEKERLFAGFDQVEAFVSGPVTISGFTAAFARTILLVVKDVSCRMTWQGIAVVDYDEEYRIKRWQDYWNEEEFERQWKGCQWPVDDEEGVKADVLSRSTKEEL